MRRISYDDAKARLIVYGRQVGLHVFENAAAILISADTELYKPLRSRHDLNYANEPTRVMTLSFDLINMSAKLVGFERAAGMYN